MEKSNQSTIDIPIKKRDTLPRSQEIPPVPNPKYGVTKEYKDLAVILKFEQQFAKLIRLLLFSTSVLLAVLMAAQVFVRYVLQTSFLGMEELAPFLALWAYFLGMIYSTRSRSHISGGVLTLITTNGKVLLALRLLGTILCIMTLVIFCYYSIKVTQFNLKLNRSSVYLGWSKSLWDLSMVFGFASMILYYLLQCFIEARKLIFGGKK